ncbi:intermembrane phospholipid transport protein YdbH family protein [Asticcacaulis endophyticus]|nr:YdbH domain-containing protein [Asticcacaulis endophyticus]
MTPTDPTADQNDELMFPVRTSTLGTFSRVVSGDAKAGGGEKGRPAKKAKKGGGNGRPPKSGAGKAGQIIGLTLCGVAAIGVAAVVARKEIAREIAQGWLRSQQIDSELKIGRLGLDHAEGSIRLGKATSPDVILNDFRIDYDLNLFAGQGKPMARFKRIHLTKPEIALALTAKGLDFGSLDPLIQSILSSPSNKGEAPGEVLIENAVVRLKTDYGTINATGRVQMQAGRLQALNLNIPSTRLSGPLGEGTLSDGFIKARSVGDGLKVEGKFVADAWEMKPDKAGAVTRLKGVRLELTSNLPYRQLEQAANLKASPLAEFSGPLETHMKVAADELNTGDTALKGVTADASILAALSFERDETRLEGQSRFQGRAQSVTQGAMFGRDVYLDASSLNLSFAHSSKTPTAENPDQGGAHVWIDGPLQARIGLYRQDGIEVSNARADLEKVALHMAGTESDISFKGSAYAGRMVAADLSLDRVNMTVSGNARAETGLNGAAENDASAWTAAIKTSLNSRHGSYKGLDEMAQMRRKDLQAVVYPDPVNTDPPPVPVAPIKSDAVLALQAAAQAFSLEANDISIKLDGAAGKPAAFDVRTKTPITVTPASGGKLTLTPDGARPLIASADRAAFGVKLEGEDLPEVNAFLSDMGFGASGELSGKLAADAKFNFAPVTSAETKATGRFTVAGGRTHFVLDDCMPFSAARADIGGRLEGLTASICATEAPILTLENGQWQSAGAFDELKLNAPDYEARVTNAKGRFNAFSTKSGAANGAGFRITVAAAEAHDTAAKTRFNPVTLAGKLDQDAVRMTGRLGVKPLNPVVRERAPGDLARIDIVQDARSDDGYALISTGDMVFAPDGLQPIDLTPQVATVATKNVTGSATFDGRFDWSRTGTPTSQGRLRLNDIDFEGPLGKAQDLRGDVEFTSLSPLMTPPGQIISVASLTTAVPLTDINTSVQFLGDHLSLAAATAMSPGGQFGLEPMDVPLAENVPIKGALTFSELDFGKIIAATDLGRDMKFEGTVTGRMPFEINGNRVHFAQGELKGDGPGRLSIQRAALQGVASSGGVTTDAPQEVAPSPADASKVVEGMAYQALENMAYSDMSATINSLENGRLGFNFKIKGRYDPPKKQEARVSYADVLRGRLFDKPINLPSDTGVDLNLDMTLNLDQVLDDLMAFEAQKAGLK